MTYAITLLLRYWLQAYYADTHPWPWPHTRPATATATPAHNRATHCHNTPSILRQPICAMLGLHLRRHAIVTPQPSFTVHNTTVSHTLPGYHNSFASYENGRLLLRWFTATYYDAILMLLDIIDINITPLRQAVIIPYYVFAVAYDVTIRCC